jgi:hypothetical protein
MCIEMFDKGYYLLLFDLLFYFILYGVLTMYIICIKKNTQKIGEREKNSLRNIEIIFVIYFSWFNKEKYTLYIHIICMYARLTTQITELFQRKKRF